MRLTQTAGIAGLYVCGSTGEGLGQTVEQRKVQSWAEGRAKGACDDPQALLDVFVCSLLAVCLLAPGSLLTASLQIMCEAAIKAVHKRVPVMVMVAAHAVEDAVALAQHAQLAGADAISSGVRGSASKTCS